MIVIAGMVIGAVIGGLVARSRGGAILDLLQYATGYAIAFGLVAVFVTIVLDRTT